MTIVVTVCMVTTITTAYCDSTATADTIANTTAAASLLDLLLKQSMFQINTQNYWWGCGDVLNKRRKNSCSLTSEADMSDRMFAELAPSQNKRNQNFHGCTAHLDTIKVFYLPTDAQ
jgi:hypothetical protein